MKRFWGVLTMIVLLAGCDRPMPATVKTRHGTSPRLIAIDTLMQSQPDSALVLLLDSTMDDPYYQLLLSEALYKNDYAQTNRSDLLDAMAYYDSLCSRDAARHVSTNDVFLSARCHYMNGVGYYEMDSVVPACAEYMKALEIMEKHFEEKELVGYKAKFMALTNTHLCSLFSDQYLNDQTINFGKEALFHFYRYDAEPWHIAWVLDMIGSHYFMLNQKDSANYYFGNALAVIPDTNNLTYRDITTTLAMLSYDTDKNPQVVLRQLHGLLALSESNNEYLSRCLSIGEVFFNEQLFDSAWFYLNKVFNESNRINPRKQAAEWLIDICKAQGKNNETLNYASFLVPFANQEENKSELKSQLTELYKSYGQERLERQHRDKTQHNRTRVTILFLGLLLVLSIIVALYHSNKKKKQNLEVQIKEERFAHEIKQKALSGRLKKSNKTLRDALKRLEEQNANIEYDESNGNNQTLERFENFMQTPICQEITAKVEQLHGDKRMSLKTNMNVACYKSFALSSIQLVLLSNTVEEYFPGFYSSLKTQHPSMSQKEWRFCLLYLLQLDKLSICVLLQEPYHTCRRYTQKIEQTFECEHGLPVFLLEQVLRFKC